MEEKRNAFLKAIECMDREELMDLIERMEEIMQKRNDRKKDDQMNPVESCS